MLSELCRKINGRAGDFLRSEYESEHERYMELYKHIEASDAVIAECFNGWRRSNLWLKLPLLGRHGLLADEHIRRLSDESRELLAQICRTGGGIDCRE